VKLQLITGHYTDEGYIRLYARGEDYERRVFDVVGFEPYSGVLAGAKVPNDPRIVGVVDVPPGLYGEPLKGLVYANPGVVPEIRQYFDERWEDDVRFVRRMMIDVGLKSGFVEPESKKVHYTELRPVDFSLPPLACFWDLEMYADKRVPNPSHPDQAVTCATFWDGKNRHYYTLLLDDERRRTHAAADWTIFHFPDERMLLQAVVKWLERLQPDVLAEWGRLDREYFPPRAKRHGLKTDVFRTMCVFDVMPGYKKLYKKGSNRLKDVAFDEGIIDRVPPEVNFAELWDNDRMALATKNKHDVEWLVKLNEVKGDLIRFFWNLKNAAGLEDLQETTYHGVLVDTRLLRKYHGRYMLPSRPERRVKRDRLLGALVKRPPVGLFKDVALVDFSRYYPNLMIGVLSALDQDWVMPIVELCQELMDERDYYDELLVRHDPDSEEYKTIKGMRDSVKYIGEAVIGYFGSAKSRVYNPSVFEGVTRPAQEGLLYAEGVCKRLGHRVLYYDTDGLFAEIKLDEVEGLLDELNHAMTDWCEERDIKGNLRLKLDRFFGHILFKGVKKRYAGHVVFEDGKEVDYLHIKGFEYIRRDSSLVTRAVQRAVFEHLLRKGIGGLREILSETLERVRGGGYGLREIALSKGIHQRFEDYDPKPDYVRGALWANKYLDAGIRPGDQVYMVYVKRTPGYPSTDVVCFLDPEIVPGSFVIDYEKMIKRTIEGKVDELLKLGGLSWGQVMGMKSLRGLFA